MKKRVITGIVIGILLLCVFFNADAASYKAVINKSTRVHVLPASDAKSVKVPKGLTVKVMSYSNGWCHIKRGDAKGYIKAEYLSAASAGNIDKVILVAMKQVGKRYGRNPPKKFDCSALVQYAFKKGGYKVKGTAASIAGDNKYSKVSRKSLKKGDIICMDANSDLRCDHVGIYIGKDYMIEASFTAGRVRVKKLNSWYKKHIMFARRVS